VVALILGVRHSQFTASTTIAPPFARSKAWSHAQRPRPSNAERHALVKGLKACVPARAGQAVSRTGRIHMRQGGGWTLDSNMHELPFPFPAHAESWESFAR